MVITTEFLAAVFTTFDAVFQDAFTQGDVGAPPFVQEMTSTSAASSYNFLGSTARTREFKGERQPTGATSNNFMIRNRKWEASIEVDRETLEDDQLDQVTPLIQGLAYEAQRHPRELSISLLASGFTTPSWDGKNFFDNHLANVPGSATQAWLNNNLGNTSLGSGTYSSARAALRLANDDKGRPLDFPLSKDNTFLVTGPNLEEVATQLLNSDFTLGPVIAKGGGGAGTLGSNVWKGTASSFVSAYIQDWSWALLFTGRPGSRPLIMQWRVKPQLIHRIDPQTSDAAYDRDTFQYGTRARYNVGYGFFAAAVGSKGNNNNA